MIHPDLILQLANRHSRYQEIALAEEKFARPVDLRQLKQLWLSAMERAETLFERLPPEELGCLYLDAANVPVTPDPESPAFAGLIRHFGSVRGAWPEIVG